MSSWWNRATSGEEREEELQRQSASFFDQPPLNHEAEATVDPRIGAATPKGGLQSVAEGTAAFLGTATGFTLGVLVGGCKNAVSSSCRGGSSITKEVGDQHEATHREAPSEQPASRKERLASKASSTGSTTVQLLPPGVDALQAEHKLEKETQRKLLRAGQAIESTPPARRCVASPSSPWSPVSGRSSAASSRGRRAVAKPVRSPQNDGKAVQQLSPEEALEEMQRQFLAVAAHLASMRGVIEASAASAQVSPQLAVERREGSNSGDHRPVAQEGFQDGTQSHDRDNSMVSLRDEEHGNGTAAKQKYGAPDDSYNQPKAEVRSHMDEGTAPTIEGVVVQADVAIADIETQIHKHDDIAAATDDTVAKTDGTTTKTETQNDKEEDTSAATDEAIAQTDGTTTKAETQNGKDEDKSAATDEAVDKTDGATRKTETQNDKAEDKVPATDEAVANTDVAIVNTEMQNDMQEDNMAKTEEDNHENGKSEADGAAQPEPQSPDEKEFGSIQDESNAAAHRMHDSVKHSILTPRKQNGSPTKASVGSLVFQNNAAVPRTQCIVNVSPLRPRNENDAPVIASIGHHMDDCNVATPRTLGGVDHSRLRNASPMTASVGPLACESDAAVLRTQCIVNVSPLRPRNEKDSPVIASTGHHMDDCNVATPRTLGGVGHSRLRNASPMTASVGPPVCESDAAVPGAQCAVNDSPLSSRKQSGLSIMPRNGHQIDESNVATPRAQGSVRHSRLRAVSPTTTSVEPPARESSAAVPRAQYGLNVSTLSPRKQKDSPIVASNGHHMDECSAATPRVQGPAGNSRLRKVSPMKASVGPLVRESTAAVPGAQRAVNVSPLSPRKHGDSPIQTSTGHHMDGCSVATPRAQCPVNHSRLRKASPMTAPVGPPMRESSAAVPGARCAVNVSPLSPRKHGDSPIVTSAGRHMDKCSVATPRDQGPVNHSRLRKVSPMTASAGTPVPESKALAPRVVDVSSSCSRKTKDLAWYAIDVQKKVKEMICQRVPVEHVRIIRDSLNQNQLPAVLLHEENDIDEGNQLEVRMETFANLQVDGPPGWWPDSNQHVADIYAQQEVLIQQWRDPFPGHGKRQWRVMICAPSGGRWDDPAYDQFSTKDVVEQSWRWN